MLAKEFRLTKEKDFDKIWKKGRSFFIKEMGIKFLTNNLNCSRFGFIIPNKAVKQAVDRNKIKRRLREIIRLKLSLVKKGIDCVILVRQDIKALSYQDLEERVDFMLYKARLFK